MNLINKITQLFNTNVVEKEKTKNLYNESFFGMVGQTGTNYDANGKLYVDKGYNINSVIYSIVQQQSRKTADIPYFVKEVKDETKAKHFKRELKRGNINDPQTKMLLKAMQTKAFDSGQGDVMPLPLEKPNIFQSWTEFMSLYKTYLKLNGNVYIYQLMPDEGKNEGVPIAFYLMPSHLMNIVLKSNANILLDENPIDYYTLIDGTRYKKFEEKTIIHIKYSNPNFDLNGSHLYGQSPLKAALKNIESSNEGMNQNIKTLKNSGVYGFIHGKSQPITPDQAVELKDRLTEMDDNPERLSRIAGISAEIGFTRLSLTTDELRPFEYLDYDQKQLCNVLGWKDVLLNNSDSNNWDSVKEFKKDVVVSDIMPDLGLFEEAFNTKVLPKYKGYENTMLYFDASTLPEMQADMQTLTTWLSKALVDGVINRNEYREALNYPLIEDNEDFNRFTTKMGIVPLEDTFVEMSDDITIDEEKKSLVYKAGFDPNQRRNPDGTWGNEGGSSSASTKLEDKPCFKEWFGDSKVVDENGKPQKFYHGTTHKFDEFTNERGNIENDMGIGFYFSSSRDDVEQNYDDLNGKDLENRIELFAEQLNYNDDYSYDEAIKIATDKLSGGENIILETYLSISNPVIIGGNKETYLDYSYNFDEDSDYYGDESGAVLDFMDSFRNASAGYYDVDANAVFQDIEFYDGISISDLIKGIKSNENLSYATNDDGKLAINEIIRATFEDMGFDGIIDNTVQRFNMQGIYGDTQHVIAFEPNQVKSVHAESFCHETNINKSLNK